MHRLTEHQLVTVSPPPDLARVSSFESYVVAIDGPVVSLHAARAADVAWLPPKLDEVMLSFERGGTMVALNGALRWQASTEDLRFRVGDRVYVPRRRSSPLQLCTPVALAPVAPDGRPAGGEIAVQTHELAPDGIVLEAGAGVGSGQFDVAVTLPQDPAPIRARGVVRASDAEGRARVEFLAMAPVERRRVRAFVADHLRERLKLVRAYQELDDEPF